MSPLWRRADAHARETIRSIVRVVLAAAAGPRGPVPGHIRIVVGRWVRVIILLARRRIVGVVNLLVRSLMCGVWILVGHVRRCRRVPGQKRSEVKVGWISSLTSTCTGLSLRLRGHRARLLHDQRYMTSTLLLEYGIHWGDSRWGPAASVSDATMGDDGNLQPRGSGEYWS